MKTALEKLIVFALMLVLAGFLFLPMRSGRDDVISFSADRLILKTGQEYQLGYALESETIQPVLFASDAPTIVQVDQSGRVRAVSPGRAAVRVTAQSGVFDEISVIVEGVPITSLSLNTGLLTMNKGEVSGLTVKANAGADLDHLEWRSLDPSVALVSGDGRVEAVGAGETEIVVSTNTGVAASAQVRVNVLAQRVMITPDELRVGVGSSFTMRTRCLPEDATDRPRKWVSSDQQVVSVDNSGLIHALAPGSALLSVATDQGLTASAELVVEPPSSSFAVNLTDLTLQRGESAQLEASFLDDDGRVDTSVHHHVDWESSDPAVANVEEGLVRALSTGSATITASADGFRAQCRINVRTDVTTVVLSENERYLLREDAETPIQLSAEIEPLDADDTTVTFETDNALVAEVDEDGLVTMTGGYGTAVITARCEGGAYDTFTVHVVVELPQAQDEAMNMDPERTE